MDDLATLHDLPRIALEKIFFFARKTFFIKKSLDEDSEYVLYYVPCNVNSLIKYLDLDYAFNVLVLQQKRFHMIPDFIKFMPSSKISQYSVFHSSRNLRGHLHEFDSAVERAYNSLVIPKEKLGYELIINNTPYIYPQMKNLFLDEDVFINLCIKYSGFLETVSVSQIMFLSEDSLHKFIILCLQSLKNYLSILSNAYTYFYARLRLAVSNLIETQQRLPADFLTYVHLMFPVMRGYKIITDEIINKFLNSAKAQEDINNLINFNDIHFYYLSEDIFHTEIDVHIEDVNKLIKLMPEEYFKDFESQKIRTAILKLVENLTYATYISSSLKNKLVKIFKIYSILTNSSTSVYVPHNYIETIVKKISRDAQEQVIQDIIKNIMNHNFEYIKKLLKEKLAEYKKVIIFTFLHNEYKFINFRIKKLKEIISSSIYERQVQLHKIIDASIFDYNDAILYKQKISKPEDLEKHAAYKEYGRACYNIHTQLSEIYKKSKDTLTDQCTININTLGIPKNIVTLIKYIAYNEHKNRLKMKFLSSKKIPFMLEPSYQYEKLCNLSNILYEILQQCIVQKPDIINLISVDVKLVHTLIKDYPCRVISYFMKCENIQELKKLKLSCKYAREVPFINLKLLTYVSDDVLLYIASIIPPNKHPELNDVTRARNKIVYMIESPIRIFWMMYLDLPYDGKLVNHFDGPDFMKLYDINNLTVKHLDSYPPIIVKSYIGLYRNNPKFLTFELIDYIRHRADMTNIIISCVTTKAELFMFMPRHRQKLIAHFANDEKEKFIERCKVLVSKKESISLKKVKLNHIAELPIVKALILNSNIQARNIRETFRSYIS